MRKRPDLKGVLRLGLLSAACSASLLSPAGAAQVDYFKTPTTKVPAVQKPESKLPAVQQGTAPGINKATPQLLLPAVKGAPPSGIMGPNQIPGQQGKVFPKVEIHAIPPEQMPAPPGKPHFRLTHAPSLGEGSEAMNKATPILMKPGSMEPPPPGQAGDVMQKVAPFGAPGVETPQAK